MRRIITKWIPIAISTGTGLVALAGYLFPQTVFSAFRDRMVEWAVIIAAFALILGLFNLVRVHGQRILGSGEEWGYSLVLLLSASLSWIPALVQGPSGPATKLMLDYVITPLGASLAALLVFTLTLSGVRMLRYRSMLSSVLFIVVFVVSLLGTTPLPGTEWLSKLRHWLIHVPGRAGFRGLFLGVALGTMVTGLRILLGADRPHSES